MLDVALFWIPPQMIGFLSIPSPPMAAWTVTGSFGRSLQVVSADARSMTSQLSVDGDCPPQTRSFEKPFAKIKYNIVFWINC